MQALSSFTEKSLARLHKTENSRLATNIRVKEPEDQKRPYSAGLEELMEGHSQSKETTAGRKHG